LRLLGLDLRAELFGRSSVRLDAERGELRDVGGVARRGDVR
jgi:hypothetical protein